MKKTLLILAALTLSAGLWAQIIHDDVPYIDANGQRQTADYVFEIRNIPYYPLRAGWYVVCSTDVQTGTLVCNGAVHLILADGAKLTATGTENEAGIQVSGEGNSSPSMARVLKRGN